MTQEELNRILALHEDWLMSGGERVNLVGANLDGMDFTNAKLSRMNFLGASLKYANFTGVDLIGSTLKYANFTGTNFTGAKLGGATLTATNFTDANFAGANLSGAIFSHTNLTHANFKGADLFRAALPLWCGGLNWKLDRLQMSQLAYHFCSMQCEDEAVKKMQIALYDFANEFADSRSDLKNKKFSEVSS